MPAAVEAPNLPTLTYPRTGKRGVPQQFPRRLFEMLESESKTSENIRCNEQNIIAWSDSGQAFRIFDVSRFASQILPKYFRTSKFSSFQRNLNLYGFSKVRRGPDTDMYHHPSFTKGRPENLSHLRKCNSAAARRRLLAASKQVAIDNDLGVTVGAPQPKETTSLPSRRTVSPPLSPPRIVATQVFTPIVPLASTTTQGTQLLMPAVWPQLAQIPVQVVAAPSTLAPSASSQTPPPTVQSQHKPPSPSSDSGRLDLLTMAMTSLEQQEG